MKKRIVQLAVCMIAATGLFACGSIFTSEDKESENLILPPSAQVTNNQTTTTFVSAKIGSVTISGPPTHGYCAEGCSSGFYDVATGTNTITIDSTDYGTLSPFNNNTSYAVNIRDGGCAELWIRTNTNSTYNDDTTKTFVTNNGKCL